MRGGRGIDHGEGVEAGRVLAEGDEGAAQCLGGVLEGASVVDHHGLAAGADDAGHQLLHQHRLAGAGFAGHCHVVVAGVVGERRPAGRLAPAPDQQQRRRVVRPGGLAAPFAVHRRQVDRRRGQQRLHPAHAGEVGVEPAARHHRQAGKPGRELDIALGDHPPALAVIDRAHRLLGLVDGVQGRIDRDRVAGPDQAFAVLQPLGHDLPVARLLRQPGQIACQPGAGLLGRAGRFEERLLARRLVAGGQRQCREHRAAGLQEVAVEVADQRVAAPARPDLGEGNGREHPHGNVAGAVITAASTAAVRGPGRSPGPACSSVVEHETRRRHGEHAPGRGALEMQRIARRPAPYRAGEAAPIHGVIGSGRIRRGQLGGERQQRIGAEPPGGRAGRGEGAFERPAEGAERGLRGRSGGAGQRRRDEHPVVGEREGRAAGVQLAPAGMGEKFSPTARHLRLHRPGATARRRPGGERRAEARARPVDDLHRAALGRGVCERARQRTQRLGVDPGKGRDLDDEAAGAGVDIDLARLVEGAPRQQLGQRRRAFRR